MHVIWHKRVQGDGTCLFSGLVGQDCNHRIDKFSLRKARLSVLFTDGEGDEELSDIAFGVEPMPFRAGWILWRIHHPKDIR
jgi:hypothetical protein